MRPGRATRRLFGSERIGIVQSARAEKIAAKNAKSQLGAVFDKFQKTASKPISDSIFGILALKNLYCC